MVAAWSVGFAGEVGGEAEGEKSDECEMHDSGGGGGGDGGYLVACFKVQEIFLRDGMSSRHGHCVIYKDMISVSVIAFRVSIFLLSRCNLGYSHAYMACAWRANRSCIWMARCFGFSR